MTSTVTLPVMPTPTPANPTFREVTSSGGKLLLVMTSMTSGTVINSTDPSVHIGYYDAAWTGTVPSYATSVTINA